MSAALEAQSKDLYPFQGVDHLAWAKRILWREASGDQTLSLIQLRFAKEAMGETA